MARYGMKHDIIRDYTVLLAVLPTFVSFDRTMNTEKSYGTVYGTVRHEHDILRDCKLSMQY